MKLYKKDAKNRLRFYSVIPYADGYTTSSGICGMSSSVKIEDHPVKFGMANRSQQEQINLRIKSVINRRKDQGWVETKDEAEKGITNQLGFVLPMTAKKYSEKFKFTPNIMTFIQRKYNGHRCLITNNNGENIAYSRGGKLITSIEEILKDIVIPEGETIDGELYRHGWSLQKISSAVRKRQDETKELRFMCYDIISNLTFHERFFKIKNKVKFCSRSELVPTTMCYGEYDPFAIMREFIEEGYEGAMLRTNDAGYASGKRSSSLLKVKSFLDDEFMVIGIEKSVDGWAILNCITHKGLEFSCSAPGTHEEKRHVYLNKEKYLGKYVTVKYPEFTDDGIPSQPVAVAWREKHEE